MERIIDIEIENLKKLLQTMIADLILSLRNTINSLLERNNNKLELSYKKEIDINLLHLNIDKFCVELLAKRSPLAGQLRQVVAIIKINNELERIGDKIINLARNSERYLQNPIELPKDDLIKMVDEIIVMINDAWDSFDRNNLLKSFDIIRKDDFVDSVYRKIIRDMFTYVSTHPHEVNQVMSIVFIAKNLEQMADDIASIAEHAVFSISGEDVRHRHDRKKENSTPKILFFVRPDTGVGPMAHGLIKSMFNNKIDVVTVSTSSGKVHPMADHVMKEIGIDLNSFFRFASSDSIRDEHFDFIISLEDIEVYPNLILQSDKRLHWNIVRPNDTFEDYRRVREDIEKNIISFKQLFYPE